MTTNGNETKTRYQVGSWITSDGVEAQYLAMKENCGTSGGAIIEIINDSYIY